jgi:hypothetical protein
MPYLRRRKSDTSQTEPTCALLLKAGTGTARRQMGGSSKKSERQKAAALPELFNQSETVTFR